MRFVLAMFCVCLVAGVASADEKGYGDGAADARQGGESSADATVIPGLPYDDSGATCDNAWDIDFICGFTGGESPDVWYSYTACEDGVIDASLCGSGYDTQLAIFDADLNEVACNDDACDLQSEIVGAPVVGGSLYYIVVSGFFGSCGSYVLNVSGPECPVPVEESTWGQIKREYR